MEQKGKYMIVQMITKNGTSAHNAIMVGSVSDEYDWIEQNYPDCIVVRQRLTSIEGMPFDILTLWSANGDEQDVYFDISGFFRLL